MINQNWKQPYYKWLGRTEHNHAKNDWPELKMIDQNWKLLTENDQTEELARTDKNWPDWYH